MKTVCLTIAVLFSGLSTVAYAGSGYDLTTPREQLEQSCDVEAMKRLNADKVIAYTFANPLYTDTHIDAPGAVFRRHEQWYRLEYHCSTGKHHRTVVAFDMKVGAKVARSDWDRYYLYP